MPQIESKCFHRGRRPVQHKILFLLSFFGAQPFPKQQILDSSKLKELADDDFKFDENARKSIQMGRKHCGKRRNCSLRAISPFPTVFSRLILQTRKNPGLFVKGLTCILLADHL